MQQSSSVSDTPIRVVDLKKRYSAGLLSRKKVDALSGVSFDVPRGQVYGLLGPNGAGKTTIIKILLGIVRSTGGKAELLGHPAGNRAGRRRVGYLPENLQLPSHQNAETALEYFGRLSGLEHSVIKQRGGELLERVGLDRRKKESVKNYSKGMRQRLGLAQALIHDPELLVLDEPTDGLDPVGRAQVRDLLRDFGGRGNTVFLNSHLLQEVEMVCDKVAILNRGTLKYTGSLDAFFTDNEIELDLLLYSGEPKARSVLAGFDISKCDVKDNGRLSMTLRVKDQPEVDRVVDSLRAGGVSIEAIAPRKQTLEDLFLEVVSGPYQA